MKPGDIVKFTDRYEKQKGRTFLVLERHHKGDYNDPDDYPDCMVCEPDDSMWAQWAIIDMINGSVYTQIGRDLEAVNAAR